MYPLAQLGSLDLNAVGLKIPQSEIYQPGKTGLTNALVRLGGCTGSFISEEGLIITNHHCVFSSVAAASSAEYNYLERGFYASKQEDEIKTSLPCRITLSFDDVSDKVLEGTESLEPADKKTKIAENIKAIKAEEEKQNPDLEIDISEMFVGRFYTLFRYKLLEDVRLVYVPPKAVGKFGGEEDNWMWPRHNADFSVVRAYENGKPYKPEKFLKINSNGTRENDFVFILGYPGTTYRHAPAEFLDYQYKHILPVISEWFDTKIEMLEKDAQGDEAKQLRYAGMLASLNNTSKNFKGKLQGLTRTNIISQRYAEQEELQLNVARNPGLVEKYGSVIPRLHDLFEQKMKITDDYLLLNQMYSSSGLFHVAQFVNNGHNRMEYLGKSGSRQWINDEKENLLAELRSEYRIFTPELDREMFAGLIFRIHNNGGGRMDEVLKMIHAESGNLHDINAGLSKIWSKSKWLNSTATIEKFKANPMKFFKQNNKLVKIASVINQETDELRQEWKYIQNETDALMPRLAEMREQYFGGTFVPDANSTLRLTYGFVRGYSPQDAVYDEPYTTISGILEKADTSAEAERKDADYYLPGYIYTKFKTIQASDNLVHPVKKQVVVGMLYNLDTTGGNSGSPILDANGNLVGINFDRAYTATINDFAWNESYSRSIGVDIRFVLYVMKYIGGADNLLKELNVEL